MKKLVAFILVLALLCSVAVLSLAQDEQTLTVWYSGNVNGKAATRAAETYEAAHPGVKINIEMVATSDRETRLTVALTSGDMTGLPDITLFQDYSAQKFLQFFPGCFVDLSKALNMADFTQEKVGYWTSGDGVYALPFDSGASALFVRLDYLEAAGYSLSDLENITWDEYIDIGKKVQEATGKYMLTETDYTNLTMAMVKSAGRWYFEDDGTVNLTKNEAVIETVKTIQKLHDAGIVMENGDWASFVASLNNGDAASVATGNWILGSIVGAADQSGKWGMAPMPALSKSTGHYGSAGGSSWAVLSSSKQQELAVDYLKEFLTDDFNTYLISELATVPSYLPAQKLPCASEPYAFTAGQAVFADIMRYAQNTPVIAYGPYNAEVTTAMANVNAEVIGGKDLTQALQDAQDNLVFLMEK